MCIRDRADTEQLLRIIQSIPSPKAEPFKLWLAQVGRERIEETIDPVSYTHLDVYKRQERELEEMMGIHRMTSHNRKIRILQKLKKMLR